MKAQPWPPPGLGDWIESALSDQEPEWWIDKLLPADAITLVSGPAKVGHKTLSLMAMVRCLIANKGMPGIKLMNKKPCNVLWIEYEGPRKSLAHFWKWFDNGAGWETDYSTERCRWAHRYNSVRITDPEWADRIVELMTKEKRSGLVVDTFTRSAMAPENDATAMTEAFMTLDRVRNSLDNGWVAYVHHLRKDADNWDEDIDLQVRGSGAWSAHYDHHLAFRAGFHSGTLFLFTRSKVDEERYFRWVWHVNKDEARITFDIFEFDMRGPPGAWLIRECTEAIPDTQVHTAKGLAELWNTPKPPTYWIIDAMCEAGILVRTARGFKKIGG